MTSYSAPLADMQFVIREVAGLEAVRQLPGHDEVTPDLVAAILEEAGRFAEDVLAPLNLPGDVAGSRLENGVVRTPAGFKEAYARFVEGGWNGVVFDADVGGQGLPALISAAIAEILHGANMSFGLCPLLTQGAAELVLSHGSPEIRGVYAAKLVTGEWTGTMNLTEPQAGSDLGGIRTRAVPDDGGEPGRYRITGQKIFITYGEHDFTDNIVHLVLARTPDGPPGIKGLSLFLVPKVLVNADGTLGDRNDVRCVSLEHKLGIRASPTALLSYGDGGGAVGYLVGEENGGIQCMFTMMNSARLAVGLEGVGIAERAYQQARAYARARLQGTRPGKRTGDPVAIVEHPDVRRMLLSMKAQTEAARSLAYYVAACLDMARGHDDPDSRRAFQARVDLLVPVVKGWSTDVGIRVADTGIQVHGGMGYIEETGAAQHLRDARIGAIYEGTNGIQANDLVGRKVVRDGGAAVAALLADIGSELTGRDGAHGAIEAHLAVGADALERATRWIVDTHARDHEAVAAGAAHYLRLLALVAAGWLSARAAERASEILLAGGGDDRHLQGKVVSARFFAEQVLSRAPQLATVIVSGAETVRGLDTDLL